MINIEFIEIIKKMPHIHCARGPRMCKTCQEMEAKENTYALVKVFLEPGEYARPITEVIIKGERIYGEYDIIQRFDDIIDAKAHAAKNNVEIVSY